MIKYYPIYVVHCRYVIHNIALIYRETQKKKIIITATLKLISISMLNY